MKQHRTLIIGLAMVALIAVGAVAALAVSSDGPGSPHEYTAAEDGAAIEIAAGESFTVVLEGNPTTGYGWLVDDLDEAVLSVEETAYRSDSDLIGSGGTFTFTFTGAAAGTTQVRLGYQRSWEFVEPIQAFGITVTVR